MPSNTHYPGSPTNWATEESLYHILRSAEQGGTHQEILTEVDGIQESQWRGISSTIQHWHKRPAGSSERAFADLYYQLKKLNPVRKTQFGNAIAAAITRFNMTCECGEGKAMDAKACPRCLDLDSEFGRTMGHRLQSETLKRKNGSLASV